MKIFTNTAACLLLCGLGQAAQCQEAPQAKPHNPAVLGYMDARTGAFRPLAPVAPDNEQAAATAAVYTGKFVYNFTINVASSLSSGAAIQCSAQASVYEIGSVSVAREYIESATVTASRNGSTATCTVTIPYSWSLQSAGSDTVQLSFNIIAGAAPTRLSDHIFANIAVPVNGATTVETLKPTI